MNKIIKIVFDDGTSQETVDEVMEVIQYLIVRDNLTVSVEVGEEDLEKCFETEEVQNDPVNV